jgi:predicted ATP-dependent serine protease
MTKTTEQISSFYCHERKVPNCETQCLKCKEWDDIIEEKCSPTPQQGEEGYDITTLWMNAEKKLRESLERESALTAELTALRSQLSEAQENYEKVWDAAVESHWYDTIKGKGGVKLTTTPPPDKNTFINKIKKGKE